jgi:hypothetical protein
MRTSNTANVSLPGYREILTGHVDETCLSNDCAPLRVPTLLDEARDFENQDVGPGREIGGSESRRAVPAWRRGGALGARRPTQRALTAGWAGAGVLGMATPDSANAPPELTVEIQASADGLSWSKRDAAAEVSDAPIPAETGAELETVLEPGATRLRGDKPGRSE